MVQALGLVVAKGQIGWLPDMAAINGVTPGRAQQGAVRKCLL